jgi:hypothetical protein
MPENGVRLIPMTGKLVRLDIGTRKGGHRTYPRLVRVKSHDNVFARHVFAE